MSMRAVVKSVLSADTIVLRSKVVAGQIPKERTIHLAGLDSPRVGSRDRMDENWAFESRDYVRLMLVGKEVGFSISYTVPSGGEYGIVYLVPTSTSSSQLPIDVALDIVREGWSKLRESTMRDTDDEQQVERKKLLKEAEEVAKNDERGMWAPNKEHPTTDYSMPTDPAAFLAIHKNVPLSAIVESVSNGTTVRVRLLISQTQHHVVALSMAGVRSPRAKSYAPPQNESSESGAGGGGGGELFGDEAKLFSEVRLLQRNVTVRLLALPTLQTKHQVTTTTTTTTPQVSVVGSFVGLLQHPAGSISSLLVANGLARIVDWHAGFISSVPIEDGGGMERLRVAEREGKNLRRGIWKDLKDANQQVASSSSSHHHHTTAVTSSRRQFEAVVVRVWGGDLLGIKQVGKSEEKRIQISSVRMPRASEVRLAGLTLEARELLRRRLIGKSVTVTIDYVRPSEGAYEERECATVRLPNGTNVAELLVERGFASVIRHRQGEDRASDYDHLMAIETKAQSEGKGLHSTKEFIAPKITDISETASRANAFLSQFKRQGRIGCVVEYVASGSRFKLLVAKQDVKLTLVLSGIRCPKPSRTSGSVSEKGEAFGSEAFEFVNGMAMQRDAEFEVDSIDKSGGFIGGLYLNKKDNVAVLLAKEGLATFNEYSAERLAYAKDIQSAQALAQSSRKNLWRNFDGEAKVEESREGERVKAIVDYKDVIVSDVRTTPSFSFSVQILKNGGGIPELTQLMHDFSAFHLSSSASSTSASFRTGDLVSAKFSVDNAWYRAKVRKSNATKQQADVVFIDYGNSEVLPYSRLRSLDARFKSLPGQAKEARLSFVSVLDSSKSEYGVEAMDRFKSLAEGRQLVANLDYSDAGGGLLHLSLYDPSVASPTATSSINTTLVREGYAQIDRGVKYRSAYPGHVQALEDARSEARRTRSGAYEFGDVLDDDE